MRYFLLTRPTKSASWKLPIRLGGHRGSIATLGPQPWRCVRIYDNADHAIIASDAIESDRTEVAVVAESALDAATVTRYLAQAGKEARATSTA